MRELRVIVIGTSGSGKTTLGRRLAKVLDLPHIELDQVFWRPNWTETPRSEFRKRMKGIVSQPSWVMDGNYWSARDIIWPRATHAIWLNYRFALIFKRAVLRTARRIACRERLFGGNRESLYRTFCSKESILLWVLQSYPKHRREYRDIMETNRYPNLTFTELSTPREADLLLKYLSRRKENRMTSV